MKKFETIFACLCASIFTMGITLFLGNELNLFGEPQVSDAKDGKFKIEARPFLVSEGWVSVPLSLANLQTFCGSPGNFKLPRGMETAKVSLIISQDQDGGMLCFFLEENGKARKGLTFLSSDSAPALDGGRYVAFELSDHWLNPKDKVIDQEALSKLIAVEIQSAIVHGREYHAP